MISLCIHLSNTSSVSNNNNKKKIEGLTVWSFLTKQLILKDFLDKTIIKAGLKERICWSKTKKSLNRAQLHEKSLTSVIILIGYNKQQKTQKSKQHCIILYLLGKILRLCILPLLLELQLRDLLVLLETMETGRTLSGKEKMVGKPEKGHIAGLCNVSFNICKRICCSAS